ncbi:MAG: ABC transporter permease [Solirubrobacterales bacterium]|nr:ABC transporter permease [Solirubrobacterales bacterium]
MPEIADSARVGQSPWRLALRRLRRDRIALAFGALFVVLALLALAAPLWADVAGRGPNATNETGTIDVGGEQVDVVSLDGVPIGPQWRGEYFLGADANGRDVMVRLLYGARNSLLIGIAAALLTTLLATLVGLLAGFYGRWVDAVARSALDVIWAFPVVLLGVALGTALALGGLTVGPIDLAAGSIAISIAVIAVVYVPYMARPIRGEVLALRERDFVAAARAQGASATRTMAGELLPNLAPTIVVLAPLMVANAILLEAALSFLGVGVVPPDPSWGNMIDAGVERLVTAPHLAIAPGLMLVLSVLALNVFGDGVRDALDRRGGAAWEAERP